MKRKTPTLVTSAVLTLITTLFWAGFEVYRALTIKPAPPVPAAILRPLDPKLDVNSLNNISSRPFLSDDQIGNTQATSAPAGSATPFASPSPLVSPSPSASASAIPVSTQSASPTPTP